MFAARKRHHRQVELIEWPAYAQRWQVDHGAVVARKLLDGLVQRVQIGAQIRKGAFVCVRDRGCNFAANCFAEADEQLGQKYLDVLAPFVLDHHGGVAATEPAGSRQVLKACGRPSSRSTTNRWWHGEPGVSGVTAAAFQAARSERSWLTPRFGLGRAPATLPRGHAPTNNAFKADQIKPTANTKAPAIIPID